VIDTVWIRGDYCTGPRPQATSPEISEVTEVLRRRHEGSGINGRLTRFAGRDSRLRPTLFTTETAKLREPASTRDAERGAPAAFSIDVHIQTPLRLLQGVSVGDPFYSRAEFQGSVLQTIQRANGFEGTATSVPSSIAGGGRSSGFNPVQRPGRGADRGLRWGKYLGDRARSRTGVGSSAFPPGNRRMRPTRFRRWTKATGIYTGTRRLSRGKRITTATRGVRSHSAGTDSEGRRREHLPGYGGRILTPPLAGHDPAGHHADSVMGPIARGPRPTHERGFVVVDSRSDSQDALRADRVFFTGTAAGDHADPVGRRISRRRAPRPSPKAPEGKFALTTARRGPLRVVDSSGAGGSGCLT
jgi:hypothetical protein